MSCFKRYTVLTPLLFCFFYSTAQSDISGVWEGVMGREFFQKNSGQFLQINIVQNGDKICGYTYDSVINRSNDHCKAVFDGYYDKRNDQWVLTGSKFIENSGTHVFMRIKLWTARRLGKDKVEAEVGLKSGGSFVEDRPTTVLDILRKALNGDNLQDPSVENIQLKRVSTTAPELPEGFTACFPNLKKAKDTVDQKQEVKKSIDSIKKVAPPIVKKDTVTNTDITVIKIDTVSSMPTKPMPVKKADTIAMVQKMVERKNVTFGHLPINVKNITLNIYDNAIVDGDTVTIFYNGKLLVDKQLLSTKPIVIDLALDEKASKQEIVLYANNLGSIPPNTALVIVYAGDKRYELHSSASLQENAVLVFDYKPN
ncbi:MAG TPA: hypothetical protein VKH37_06565 [Ferruginibacter sp.]|nr:hypothetical protein [Ferruginibacter sp.]